jgi:CRISPR-associated protein (TIGR03986 family)
MITAPYNFVPLNEKVFYPPWAEDISHDIPFEDGESGVIDIEITAKSPIFIRDHNNSEEFCNYNGEYYIPATSVKGMIRNVLEIMSFSKMNMIDDKTYAVRDLSKAKNFYFSEINKTAIRCGWLYFDNKKLKIKDCGEPYRVSYDEIDRYFNIRFKQKFMDGTFKNANSPYKKAFKKYELLNNLSNQNIENVVFNFSKDGNKNGRETVKFDDSGNIKGKLILTGHPSARKEPQDEQPSGKIYDFVFKELDCAKIYDVDNKVFENFKFAYFDRRDTQPKESPDWTYWKAKLYSGEKIPVFFHTDITGKVSSFGLSYLYKFPYKHSIMDALFKNHTSSKIDLAEAIFGYIDKKSKSSLKGRVSFSHAKATSNPDVLDSRYVLLGTPRASYYPIYLVQNGDEYKTLMDANIVLAGRKRYPIHRNFNHQCQGDSTQTTLITPLNSNTKFKCSVRFHNLKKAEIGALLSALTFHNTSGCFHNISMAKPLGYGKIELKITNLKNLNYQFEDYLKEFESCINAEIFDGKIKWHTSEQIVNLLTMATPQDDDNLEYMELTDFAKEKNDSNYLHRYIELDGVTIKECKSIIDKDNIDSYLDDVAVFKQREKLREEKRKQEEEEKKRRKQEKEKQNLMNKEALKVKDELAKKPKEVNIQIVENFIKNYSDYEKLDEIKIKLQNIKDSLTQDKHSEVNKKFDSALKVLQNKKGNQKQYKKALDKFLKRWCSERNNRKSPYILVKLEKAK